MRSNKRLCIAVGVTIVLLTLAGTAAKADSLTQLTSPSGVSPMHLTIPFGTNLLYNGGLFSQGTGHITINFPTPVSEFGLLIQIRPGRGHAGAIDTFAVFDGQTLLGTYSGASLSVNRHGNLLLFDGAAVQSGEITKVVLESGRVDFATVPIADATPAPEPATLLLFGSGLLTLAGAARWKYRRTRRTALGPTRR
jgi:hypothetical protein